jgi:hypothetical protein
MISRARSQAPQDVELLHLEAAARAALTDNDAALDLLQKYLRLNPTARGRIENSRVFQRFRNQLN